MDPDSFEQQIYSPSQDGLEQRRNFNEICREFNSNQFADKPSSQQQVLSNVYQNNDSKTKNQSWKRGYSQTLPNGDKPDEGYVLSDIKRQKEEEMISQGSPNSVQQQISKHTEQKNSFEKEKATQNPNQNTLNSEIQLYDDSFSDILSNQSLDQSFSHKYIEIWDQNIQNLKSDLMKKFFCYKQTHLFFKKIQSVSHIYDHVQKETKYDPHLRQDCLNIQEYHLDQIQSQFRQIDEQVLQETLKNLNFHVKQIQGDQSFLNAVTEKFNDGQDCIKHLDAYMIVKNILKDSEFTQIIFDTKSDLFIGVMNELSVKFQRNLIVHSVKNSKHISQIFGGFQKNKLKDIQISLHYGNHYNSVCMIEQRTERKENSPCQLRPRAYLRYYYRESIGVRGNTQFKDHIKDTVKIMQPHLQKFVQNNELQQKINKLENQQKICKANLSCKGTTDNEINQDPTVKELRINIKELQRKKFKIDSNVTSQINRAIDKIDLNDTHKLIQHLSQNLKDDLSDEQIEQIFEPVNEIFKIENLQRPTRIAQLQELIQTKFMIAEETYFQVAGQTTQSLQNYAIGEQKQEEMPLQEIQEK